MAANFLIVGIAGKIRSGKDTLAEVFIENGFYGVSVGDMVREKSRELNSNDPNPISTENMTKTSNYLRSKLGPDFLLKEAISKFNEAIKHKSYKGLVVYSIRAPIEADNILYNGGQLIWIEANDRIRYERAMSYLRPGDKKISMEEFLDTESRQFKPDPNIPEENQMNLDYVKSRSTKVLVNDDIDINSFREKGLELIHSIKLK
jgi:dephospho-CoA kinase